MEAAEIIAQITIAEGRIWVEGDKVQASLPESLRPLVSEIKLHKPELMAEFRRRSEQFDLLDDLRQPFVGWFDSRIHLDAKAIALRQPPQWSTTVAALHRDCCNWMSGRVTVPPTAGEFRLLLRELSCSLRTIAGDEFVDYVALKQDVQAHEQFARSE